MNNDNNSGFNSALLLVLVLIALVAAGVWFVGFRGVAENNDTTIDVNLPAITDSVEDTE